MMPVISAVREAYPSIPISIDTYHSSVARVAVESGASIVNDVSGGQLDGEMHATISALHASTIQMHMRGTPQTMQSQTRYTDDVASSVGKELSSRIELAERQGIPRWCILADPGIGFGKTATGSVDLLRDGSIFKHTAGGFPTVLGASRKSWTKLALAADSTEARDFATAGAVAAAIVTGGVDVVRVHAPQVGDAVRVADLIANGKR